MNEDAKILVMVANSSIGDFRQKQATIAQMNITSNHDFSVSVFDRHIQPLQHFVSLLEKYGEVNEQVCKHIKQDDYLLIFENIENTIKEFLKAFNDLRLLYARTGKSSSEIVDIMRDFDAKAYAMVDAKTLFASVYNSETFN